jgi:hypothetical protein
MSVKTDRVQDGNARPTSRSVDPPHAAVLADSTFWKRLSPSLSVCQEGFSWKVRKRLRKAR